MAAPLEFKRRVRLPDPLDEEPRARRRSAVVPLGAAAWLAVVSLAVAIAEGAVPVERWLSVDRPAPAPYAGRPRRLPSPPSPPPATPPPPAPAKLPAPAAPIAAASNEPLDEPLPFEDDAVLAAQTAHAPGPSSEPRDRSEPSPAPALQAAAGISCEQAQAEAVQSIEVGADPGAPDLARDDYARVLDRGTWFSHCGVPRALRIDVCAAVQNGRAAGVTVRTTPGDRASADCIARAVRTLSFPAHPRLDIARTTFTPD